MASSETRTDWSVAVDELTPAQKRALAVEAPSEADLAAYHERVTEVGFVEASFEYARKQAERLMDACPVVDLEAERKERR